MRPHKEPPHKCSKNLHSVSIDDVALPSATFITPQAGVYRFQHNDDIWGFACNPPQSEGMRLLNLFGDWSDSIRRDLEDFHAALVIQPQRVSEYRILHEAIRKGVRTPPPLPQFVVSAPCEDGFWTAEAAPAQHTFYEESTWLLDRKHFAAIIFEPTEDLAGTLAESILESVTTARSMAKLVEQHADEAEKIATKLKDKEGIIASLNDYFMKPYQAYIPLEPGTSSEPATTPLNSLNSSPAASSTRRGARLTPPEELPPPRHKWHAKAPLSSFPFLFIAGPPMGAARQHHNHQGAPGTGQPLTSKARTAHDFFDLAGEQLASSVAEAFRRITVF